MQLGEISAFLLGNLRSLLMAWVLTLHFSRMLVGRGCLLPSNTKGIPLLVQNEEDNRGLKPHSLEGWLGRLEKPGLDGNLWIEVSVGG